MKRSWTKYSVTFLGVFLLIILVGRLWPRVLPEEAAGAEEPGPLSLELVEILLVLLGVHCVALFVATPSWRRRALYVTHVPWSAAGAAALFGAIIVGTVVVTEVAGLFIDVEESVTFKYLAGAGVALVVLPSFAVVLRERGADAWRALGFARHRFWRHVAVGVVAYFAFSFAAMPVLQPIVAAVLRWLGQAVKGHEGFDDYRATKSLGEHIAILGAITLAAPLLEEIIFRGVLFQTIKRYAGSAVAVVASAGIFAALHGTLFVIVNIFFLGLLFGYLFDRTGSIVPGIVLHFLFNATAAVALLFGG